MMKVYKEETVRKWTQSTADIIKIRKVQTGGLSCFIKTCFSARDMSQPALVRALISKRALTLLYPHPSKILHTHSFSQTL